MKCLGNESAFLDNGDRIPAEKKEKFTRAGSLSSRCTVCLDLSRLARRVNDHRERSTPRHGSLITFTLLDIEANVFPRAFIVESRSTDTPVLSS